MCISHFTAGIAVIGAERAIDIPVPSPLPGHRPPAQMRVTAFVCQCDRRLTSGTPVKPILKQKETDEEERCVHGAHDEAISWPEETPTADTCTAAFYAGASGLVWGEGGTSGTGKSACTACLPGAAAAPLSPPYLQAPTRNHPPSLHSFYPPASGRLWTAPPARPCSMATRTAAQFCATLCART